MSDTTTHDSGMAASATNGAVRPGMIVPAIIEGIAPDGRGVASASGRQLLVRGALPGDEVDARVFRRRGGRLEATCVSVRREGYPRREPRCAHTGQ
ncbi:MAG TPA: TRAM domain-containing protein [Candidatus Latescibacteria bacterium]|nr:TRAM domain-containing protein [Candidatus Latescibacterota bacterium]